MLVIPLAYHWKKDDGGGILRFLMGEGQAKATASTSTWGKGGNDNKFLKGASNNEINKECEGGPLRHKSDKKYISKYTH